MSHETDRLAERERDEQTPDGPGDGRPGRSLGADDVRPHHEAMRREQVGRALRRLEGLDDVTDAQRRTIRELSHRLVASLSPLAAAVERDADRPTSVRGDD